MQSWWPDPRFSNDSSSQLNLCSLRFRFKTLNLKRYSHTSFFRICKPTSQKGQAPCFKFAKYSMKIRLGYPAISETGTNNRQPGHGFKFSLMEGGGGDFRLNKWFD